MSLERFLSSLFRAFDIFENKVERRIKDTAKAIFDELVTTTPYRSGMAISNWQVRLGTASAPIVQAYSPFGGAEANAAVARSLAYRTIEQFKMGRGITIEIFNTAPYIRALNAGSSTQAPAGFIQQAVERGRAVARQRL